MTRALKPIAPTLREKKRYLAFEVITEGPAAFGDVSRALWDAFLGLFGEAGAAHAGLWLLPERYDAGRKRGLARVSHTALDQLRAALTFITSIGGKPAVARSLGASGILAKAALHATR
jgi:ribonuclease P/MRP protein subunit POP5